MLCGHLVHLDEHTDSLKLLRLPITPKHCQWQQQMLEQIKLIIMKSVFLSWFIHQSVLNICFK